MSSDVPAQERPLTPPPGTSGPIRRPPSLRRILGDLGPVYAANGLVGAVFSASGPVAVTLAVGAAGGLTEAQLASWVSAMMFSGGLATLVMSLLYRQPLGFGWSIPGTVLLGPSLQHLSFGEVVGAFFTCGVLILLIGLSGVMRRIMSRLPLPIIMAMVAAVFLRFGTDIVDSARTDLPVAGPMIAAFLLLSAVPALGRFMPPVLGTLVVGVAVVALSGRVEGSGGGPILASPVFTAPEFTWASQVELVIPLAVTVLLVQNGQGTAVLTAAGHRPPVNGFAVVSGAFSIVNAAAGSVSACVTGPTNAVLTSAGERSRQYTAALVFGVLSILFALFAPALVRFMLATPEAFVLTLGGLAMLRALLQGFVVAFSGRHTLGALITFVVTVSGLDLFNLHAAFWGIVFGFAVSWLLERQDFRAGADARRTV